MVDRDPRGRNFSEDRPRSRPEPLLSLSLNRMGCFVWDLASGRMELDEQAHAAFDILPEEYDGDPYTLVGRVPKTESLRLDDAVSTAMKDGSDHYGVYFRLQLRSGGMRWTHTQGHIERDELGRPVKVHGLVRDATEELRDTSVSVERGRAGRGQNTVVQSTTAALSRAHTVEDVLEVVREAQGLREAGVDRLVMGLLEGERVRLVRQSGDGPPFRGSRYFAIDEPLPLTEVVRTCRTRFVESPEEYARCYPELSDWRREVGINAGAYLPLIAQGRPIGVLGLLYRSRRRFDDSDRSLLAALGSSVAQNLQRAMFYEREKDLASGLQQAMLPRSIPVVPGAEIAVRYRSAGSGRDVGGDWYDVIPLPAGRVGVVIGDVQGHDVQAAAVMGQLRIVLRAYAAEGHPPATVMARASVFLHELDTDRFATCLYAEAEPATGVVQMVRAGHLDPLLRDADGSCARIAAPGGLPLGLSAEFGRLDHPVHTLVMEPGQTLVFCTDGLVEKPGTDLDDGIDSLVELIRSGPADLEELAAQLCAPSQVGWGDDDVALLLLRRAAQGGEGVGGSLQQHVRAGDMRALSVTRHMLRTAVHAWGADERADDIELVADELVTNALTHTDSSALVSVNVSAPSADAERRESAGVDLTHRVGGDAAAGAVTARTGGNGPQPGPHDDPRPSRRMLRIEVVDASSALPLRREANTCGLSGRGLQLVDALADDWGVEPRGHGKCVWSAFDIGPPADGPPVPVPLGPLREESDA